MTTVTNLLFPELKTDLEMMAQAQRLRRMQEEMDKAFYGKSHEDATEYAKTMIDSVLGCDSDYCDNEDNDGITIQGELV